MLLEWTEKTKPGFERQPPGAANQLPDGGQLWPAFQQDRHIAGENQQFALAKTKPKAIISWHSERIMLHAFMQRMRVEINSQRVRSEPHGTHTVSTTHCAFLTVLVPIVAFITGPSALRHARPSHL